jgi:hypothetical protein
MSTNTHKIYTPSPVPYWPVEGCPTPIDAFSHCGKVRKILLLWLVKNGNFGVPNRILWDTGRQLFKTHKTGIVSEKSRRMESLLTTVFSHFSIHFISICMLDLWFQGTAFCVISVMSDKLFNFQYFKHEILQFILLFDSLWTTRLLQCICIQQLFSVVWSSDPELWSTYLLDKKIAYLFKPCELVILSLLSKCLQCDWQSEQFGPCLLSSIKSRCPC